MATTSVLYRAGYLLSKNRFSSLRFHRTMSSLLIEDPKYSWLKDLGLSSKNNGVFYGVWGGSGQVNSTMSR